MTIWLDCDHMQKVPGEEVVIISQMLASEICSGYDGVRNMRLETVNGEKVRCNRRDKVHHISTQSVPPHILANCVFLFVPKFT
jgi:hypothetical protein